MKTNVTNEGPRGRPAFGLVVLAHDALIHPLAKKRPGRDDPTDSPFGRLLIRYLTHPERVWDAVRDAIQDWLAAALPVVVAAIVALCVCAFAIVLYVRVRDRRVMEKGRRIRILPPPEVASSGGEVAWTALHGLIRPRLKRALLGQPALAWEVTATEDDTQVSLWVPSAIPIAYVERALESAWPGASLLEVADGRPRNGTSFTKATELTLARPQWLPIGDGPDDDPVRVALAALTNVTDRDEATIQVLARPVVSSRGARLIRAFNKSRGDKRGLWPRHLSSGAPVRPARRDPTEEHETRLVHDKAAAPLWQCSIRLVVTAATRGQAKARIHSLATAFAMFEGSNGLRRRRSRRAAAAVAARRIDRGFLLSVKELATIATLPVTAVAGLEAATARLVAPPKALPSDGRVLGDSNRSVAGRPVAIAVKDGRHHLHVVGQTGTGKSTLLAQLVLQDAAAKRAAVVIDPKGDLVEAILARLPKGAEERTCLIDPTDPKTAVGVNVLHGDDIDLVVDHVTALFKRIYERHWGPRSDDILRASCLTLAQIPGATLADVPLLLTNATWRRAIRGHLKDPALRLFWELFDQRPEARRHEDIAPLMNKLRAFLLRGAIKTILGQASPKARIEHLIESGGLVLVRIPKGLLGEDTSRLLGGLIVARIWQAAMARVSVAERERHDIALYVDEMHNYLTLPRSFEDLLAEARGYGLSLVLAHQHLGQLTRDMRDALAANARTKIAFACSPEDAAQLEKHFEPALSAHDLCHLPAFVAACRPCVEGANGRAFTLTTAPLGVGSAMRGSEVRAKSAELFAVPRTAVEAEINSRHMRPEVALLPSTGGRSSGHSNGRSLGHSIRQPSSSDPGFAKAAGEVA